ncbi:tripartite motif-containing protein 35 [Anguilla anguilla]|uniref:tripartite motif-containing protein 35 n=1 Tax=Anguilla anguilla TaxID=7936 RepID=UPI0015ADB520|nr:tripartite motif-containing protein 35 [Anguilla anguilla]
MAVRPRGVSARSGSVLEEELSCPVCCEIFRDPVVLKCSHSFCKACLQQFWRKRTSARECPVCRRRCSATEPPVSLALKNVAETFVREQRAGGDPGRGQPGAACPAHGEPLKLFCRDDQEVLCCVCHTSRKHGGHRVSPLEEAALDLKEELKKDLSPLKKNLRFLYEAKQHCDDTTVHIKSQTQRTEQRLKEEFEQLHDFLRAEEAARLAALQEEQERKRLVVKKRTENVTREILSLSHAVIAIDSEIATNDVLFLQNYKNTKKRAQCPVQDMDPLPGVLIDVAKHVGNLKYRVWEKMLGTFQYSPVTLDPNTAYAWLSLSEDLTSVTTSGTVQKVPNNPERFDHFVFVLGSEGFGAGRHAWEVDVGGKEDWVLGVVKESISRKGRISGSPEGGFWTISHCDGGYIAMTTPRTPLELEGALERVQVRLDYAAGEVTFSDPVGMTTIYTFRDRFAERMFPFFCPGANIKGNNAGPLQICPVKVAVWNSATW